MPSLLKIDQVVLEKKSKIGKFYRQKDGQTDVGRQAIRKAHFRFHLRSAKMSNNDIMNFIISKREVLLRINNVASLIMPNLDPPKISNYIYNFCAITQT